MYIKSQAGYLFYYTDTLYRRLYYSSNTQECDHCSLVLDYGYGYAIGIL